MKRTNREGVKQPGEYRKIPKFSEFIGKAGVGGILEISSEAFIVGPTELWIGNQVSGSYPDYSATVDHERLATAVNAKRLRGVPNQNGYGDSKNPVNYPALIRFPKWAWCMHDNCRRLGLVTNGPERMECHESSHSGLRVKPRLMQMRWVAACDSGHIFDIPWKRWVGAGTTKSATHNPACTHERLSFYTAVKQGVSGYGNDIVSCKDCGRQNSMQSIQEKDKLRELGLEKCPGTQPWSDLARTTCTGQVEVLMRSASRLHFSSSLEMIEIPPWSDKKPDLSLRAALQNVGMNSTQVRLIYMNPKGKEEDIEYFRSKLQETGITLTLEEITEEILRWGKDLSDQSNVVAVPARKPKSFSEELKEEWKALGDSSRIAPEETTFVTRARFGRSHAGGIFDSIRALGIDKIVEVKKMKSVRTFLGYRRLKTTGTLRSASDQEYVAGKPPESDWLPAVELYGEGIFVDFDQDAIHRWFQSVPSNHARAEILRKKISEQRWIDAQNLVTMSSKTFPLLHSISHALIRELEFQSGYSAASIRERIYSDEEMSGILIYTGGSSSAGSLGGLAAQSDPKLFQRLFQSAITRLVHCGQDPVCRESPGQGLRGLNLAACHACSLLPETSCAHLNLALDRLLVVQGDPGTPGFCEAGVLNAI